MEQDSICKQVMVDLEEERHITLISTLPERELLAKETMAVQVIQDSCVVVEEEELLLLVHKLVLLAKVVTAVLDRVLLSPGPLLLMPEAVVVLVVLVRPKEREDLALEEPVHILEMLVMPLPALVAEVVD